MNYAISLLLATATTVDSFLLVPSCTTRQTPMLLTKRNNAQNLDSVQHEWQEEAAHIRAMESSLFEDPSLEGVVEQKRIPQKIYVEHEAHKHDSLLNEIEHAIETDPDLANFVTKKTKKTINSEFMEKESHLHDSLLTEVEHAIDTDPDLSF